MPCAAEAAAAAPTALAWREVGRPWAGAAALDWTTWVAALGDGGDALYRTLVVAGGAAVVTVDLVQPRRSGARVIHRARGELPPGPGAVGGRVRALLAAADEAAARAVEAVRRAEDGATGRAGPSPRAASPARGARGDGGLNARDDPEHRIRESACLLWEREGRPQGRAEEFWARACREEARAA